jgi:imidazolonepropionase-like amidohydrolase
LPAELALAGIRVAFTSQQPQWLRTTAALAVAHGMPRRAALAALTRTPAELIGRPERVGSLRIGCDADLAVFSGDPLDLTSRLLAVYVGGELLHGAVPARDHQEAK